MATTAGEARTLAGLLSICGDRHFYSGRQHWIYRGVSGSRFPLLPKVGWVEHTSATREKFEQSVFNIFKRAARQHLTPVPHNEWEWLALAQHHGLPTRLMDWSYNPLVAAYFAVEDRLDEDGIVYALKASKQNTRVLKESPFTLAKPIKYLPPAVVRRISVQEGIFVAHGNLETPLDENLPDGWHLEGITIPAVAKKRLRYELYRVGVHRASLFPDLDGLTAHLRWHHSIRATEIFPKSKRLPA